MGQSRRVVKILIQLVIVLAVAGCTGAPARLVVGTADTVLVNSQGAVTLPARVLDGRGRGLSTKDVRFTWISGDSVSLSPTGSVKCTRRGDALLRAAVSGLTTDFVILCRPVKGFRSAFISDAPLVVGDPPRELALGAVGVDDLPVNLLAGTATIADSTVAGLRGLTIIPRKAGSTEIFVDIGDCVHSMLVEVDEPVRNSLDLARHDQLFSVPSLRLVGGEIQSWPVPRGEYLLWLRPTIEGEEQLVLGGVSMNCVTWAAVGQKYHCLAFDNATVIVRNMRQAGRGEALEGALAIKRMDGPPPSASAPVRNVRYSPRRGKPFCRMVH